MTTNNIKSIRANLLSGIEKLNLAFALKQTQNLKALNELKDVIERSDDAVKFLSDCNVDGGKIADCINIKAINRVFSIVQACTMRNHMMLESAIHTYCEALYSAHESDIVTMSLSNKNLAEMRSINARSEDTRIELCAAKKRVAASTYCPQSSGNVKQALRLIGIAETERNGVKFIGDSFAYRALRGLFIDDSSSETAVEQVAAKRAKRAKKAAAK